MESEGQELKTGHRGDGDPWGGQRVEMERASDREMGVYVLAVCVKGKK